MKTWLMMVAMVVGMGGCGSESSDDGAAPGSTPAAPPNAVDDFIGEYDKLVHALPSDTEGDSDAGSVDVVGDAGTDSDLDGGAVDPPDGAPADQNADCAPPAEGDAAVTPPPPCVPVGKLHPYGLCVSACAHRFLKGGAAQQDGFKTCKASCGSTCK